MVFILVPENSMESAIGIIPDCHPFVQMLDVVKEHLKEKFPMYYPAMEFIEDGRYYGWKLSPEEGMGLWLDKYILSHFTDGDAIVFDFDNKMIVINLGLCLFQYDLKNNEIHVGISKEN